MFTQANNLTNASLLRMFLIGLSINLIYLSFLAANEVSRTNLNPIAKNASTVWNGSDVDTYIRPAKEFLKTGIFTGRGGLPDSHRTIGYPFFLALCMMLAGEFWVECAIGLQVLLFAIIYPALAIVARELFNASLQKIHTFLIIYAFCGAGWAYTPTLLTDQFFTVCLWSAIALGLLAIKLSKIWLWVGHFILLACAAAIRPTLSLFPVGFAALFIGLHQHCCNWKHVSFIVYVFLIQMLLCQTPAIRNFVNHGVWVPSDVVVNNLSDYLAKNTLSLTGDTNTYPIAKSGWEDMNLADRLAAKSEFAVKVFLNHPVATMGVVFTNLICNTLETHWINVFHYFRSSLHSDLKRWCALTSGLKVFHFIWALINSILTLAACIGAIRLARERQWAIFLFIFVFSLPFFYGATDAQGARFRLYLEGLILMLVFCSSPGGIATRKRFDAEQIDDRTE